MAVAFPEQIESQISGTPLLEQQSLWSFPSDRHPNKVWLQGAQIIRSGTEAVLAARGSQKLSMQLESKIWEILNNELRECLSKAVYLLWPTFPSIQHSLISGKLGILTAFFVDVPCISYKISIMYKQFLLSFFGAGLLAHTL